MILSPEFGIIFAVPRGQLVRGRNCGARSAVCAFCFSGVFRRCVVSTRDPADAFVDCLTCTLFAVQLERADAVYGCCCMLIPNGSFRPQWMCIYLTCQWGPWMHIIKQHWLSREHVAAAQSGNRPLRRRQSMQNSFGHSPFGFLPRSWQQTS